MITITMRKCKSRTLKGPSSVISMIMILSLLSMQVSPVLAAAASPQTVYVFDADDLCKLSQDCSFDKWSKGRTVVLKADIDLEDREFTPIPIFGGVFDGQGHSISGLSVNVEGSNQGLFRYLQEGGVIKHLVVEGVVTPGGDKSNIGGIVGNNSGVLEKCSFSGYVKGKDNIGGLVGRNGTSGMIINSFARGVIYGESKVGGVAGFNAGTILRCYNNSSVNTTVEEPRLNFQELTVDDIAPLKSFINVIDIGGIAGINTGVVRSSENRGNIGYPHVGYNVGGVIGRQSGYVTECSNHGSIYGRKEVGGIVGQMEPHISTTIPPSKLKELHRELNRLQSSITTLLNDTKASSNVINEGLSHVQGDLNNTKAHAESLINQTEAMLNKDIEEINRISLTAMEAMDRLIPILDTLADVVEVMDRALPLIRQFLHHSANAMSKLSELNDHYEKISDAMDYSMERLTEAGNSAQEALLNLIEALELLYNGEMDGVPELLNSAWDNLNKAGKCIEEAMEGLQTVPGHMKEIMTLLGGMVTDVGYALKYLEDAIEVLEEAMDPMSAMLRDISGLVEYLAEQPELKFETTDDVYQETKENLFRSIDSMSDSLFQLINTVKKEGDILLGDIQRVSDELFLVLGLVLDIAEEISEGEIDPEKILEDVSRNDTDGSTEGKVSNSKNFGTIEGDINVGGIAGAMAMEFLLDAEEELSIKNKPSLRAVFKTRAIMTNCENQGAVVGKKSHVGGIVGNMDLGYIKGCIVAGSVESIDGHYVGGIAGKANSLIDFSYAKSTLHGGNYVGGIAGLGQEITNCCSMVSVNRGRACIGAIAGYADNDSIIRSNYFVSHVLAGIDGISYMNRAEPVTYEEFIAIDGLPSIFKEFKVTFWVDDKLVGTIEFAYGGSIAEEDIPEIPQKPGHYGRWEGLDAANLTHDFKVKAEYSPYISVLESQKKREGPLSVALVEGEFTDEDSLSLTEIAREEEFPSRDGEFIEAWCVSIPEDGNSTHIVRFMPPEKKRNLVVYVLEDGKWIKTSIKWDGKYMVFESSGNRVTFSLVKAGFHYEQHWALLGIAAITGVLLLIIHSIIRRKTAGIPNEMKGI
jgi:ABC-type transporter Mla subunit MlaD